jgi:hypothetical protein
MVGRSSPDSALRHNTFTTLQSSDSLVEFHYEGGIGR